MSFKNYNPALVVVSFMGVNITGFMDGTFVEAERDEDAFTKMVGATGDVARSRNLNRGGKITVTLMATAAANDMLMGMLDIDELSGIGYGPFQIKDLSGTMQCFAAQAWIQKAPKMERAKESGSCVWVFDCADIDIRIGGNIL